MVSASEVGAGTRCGSRARRRCARTPGSVARRSRLERGVGNAPVRRASGCDGNSGHTSRTRSHSVITTSKRCADELVEMLGAVPLMSIPRSSSPGPRWDAAASGGSRPTRRRRPADIGSSSASSAICERALFPVHKNKTRGPPTPGTRRGVVDAGRATPSAQPGMQRTARRLAAGPGTPRDRSV